MALTAEQLESVHPTQNGELCAACGGKCCIGIPGIAVPSDFKKPLKDSIRGALATGKWCLDYWEQDVRMPQTYFVRPAVKGREGQFVDPSWGGACTFLGEHGCELDFQQRPFACRDLVPAPSASNCFSASGKGGKILVVRRWSRHQDLLKEIIYIEEADGNSK